MFRSEDRKAGVQAALEGCRFCETVTTVRESEPSDSRTVSLRGRDDLRDVAF